MKILFTFLFVSVFSLTTFATNEALLQEIIEKAKTSESDTLIIVQDDKVIHQDFFGRGDQVRNIQSVTKSIAALAVAILIDDGKISSFDTPMSHWIPEWKNDSVKSKITLRMILSQSSGLQDPKDYFKNADLVETAKNLTPVTEPGTKFIYSNAASCLLQLVISKSSATTAEDFVSQRLFLPIGITDYFWKKDKAGNESISGGLSLRATDLLKIGKLVLGNGTYKSTKVIKPETLKILMTQNLSSKAYGLMWWLAKPVGSDQYTIFRADGYGGQYITIYPAKNLVAVRTKDPYSLSENDADNERQHFPDFRNLLSAWE